MSEHGGQRRSSDGRGLRLGLAVLLLVLVVALVASLAGIAGPASSPGPVGAASGSAPPVATRVASAAPRSSLAPTGRTTQAKVKRIVDGDTIIVVIDGTDTRVRYIGMDTPESVKPGTPVQPMAKEASRANEALVGGQTVTLERDVSQTDQYGRLLRDVWVERDGSLVLVGLELVREGYAQIATFPPDVRYASALLAAERQAQRDGLGLWATPGVSPVASPVP